MAHPGSAGFPSIHAGETPPGDVASSIDPGSTGETSLCKNQGVSLMISWQFFITMQQKLTVLHFDHSHHRLLDP